MNRPQGTFIAAHDQAPAADAGAAETGRPLEATAPPETARLAGWDEVPMAVTGRPVARSFQ